jgi:hypothetical protein
MLETKKAACIVKYTRDEFITKVEANNMSLIVTGNTAPIAASSSIIPKF